MYMDKRWEQTRKALEAIVPICTAHDSDGIDIYFLNTPDSLKFLNVTSLDAVREIFGKVSPGGATMTGKRLGDIIGPYLEKLEEHHRAERDSTVIIRTTKTNTNTETKIKIKIKPLNIIVITDGCPTDGKRLESVIVEAATKLDNLESPGWQVGIQFFQVGGDRNARQSLMLLDDKLKDNYQIRDMVDTVPWKEDEAQHEQQQEEQSRFDGPFILKVVTGAVNRRLDRRGV